MLMELVCGEIEEFFVDVVFVEEEFVNDDF